MTKALSQISHNKTIQECNTTLDRADPGTAAALASRQKGSIDGTLAGLLAFGLACALLVARWPL